MQGRNQGTKNAERRGGVLRKLGLALGIGGIVVAAGVMIGCRSMPKSEIEAQIVALEKNKPLLEGRELQTLAFEFTPREGKKAVEAELRYVVVKALEPSGEAPVVCVHPTPSSLFSFTEVALGRTLDGGSFEGLNASRDVYLIDVIGHGITQTKLSSYTFQSCANYVASAIEALDLKDVCLVGNSYGGEFAWRAALDRPDLISRLVLVDSAGYDRRPDDFLPEEVAMRKIPGAGFGWLLNSRERVRTALEPHFAELSEERLTEVFLTLESSDNWGAAVDLCRDEEGKRAPELKKLKQPTLLVWGSEDLAYTPEKYGKRFEEDIPNSRLIVVPETGHYPQEERPEIFTQLMTQFLEGSLESVTVPEVR